MKSYNNRSLDATNLGSYRDNVDNYFDDDDHLPVIPALPKTVPTNPHAAIAKCGECGRKIYRVEGYSCQNNRCPVQPKIVC